MDQDRGDNTIHRPRVFSVRPQLTGTTGEVLKKKAAEKQAKLDEKVKKNAVSRSIVFLYLIVQFGQRGFTGDRCT